MECCLTWSDHAYSVQVCIGYVVVPRSWENVMMIYNSLEKLVNSEKGFDFQVARCSSWELSA